MLTVCRTWWVYARQTRSKENHVTYRSGTENFARTPRLQRRQWHLRGQRGAETGRRTSDRRNLRDSRNTSIWGITRRGRLVTKVYIGECYFDGIGHDGPFCIHRVGEDSVDVKMRCEL